MHDSTALASPLRSTGDTSKGSASRLLSLRGCFFSRPAKALIDQRMNAGGSTDIDGDTRPQGSGYNIGADEFTLRYIYLPLIMNNYP